MAKDPGTASIIFAAGKGSRMKEFEGNKTLLPLVAGQSPFEGSHPILIQILNNLPPGPKALVVNYREEDIIKATRSFGVTYCEQPLLNGTGGALLASREFIENQDCDELIITIGDVPFIKPSTFDILLSELGNSHMAVLGFLPFDKRKYGVIEFDGDNVKKITEWEYWSRYPQETQDRLAICNSGIYATRKGDLISYLDILEEKPHSVLKERNGKMVEVKEYFVTDIVELMSKDGLKVACAIVKNEDEVMGVDDLPSLKKAQKIFREFL